MNPSSTNGDAGPQPTGTTPSKAGEAAASASHAPHHAGEVPVPLPSHHAPIPPAKKSHPGNPKAFDRFRGGGKFHGGKGGGAPNYLRQHMKHGRGS